MNSVDNNYILAKKQQHELYAELDRTSKILKELSGGGPMGLTPDSVRNTIEYKKAKNEYNAAFLAVQNFNKIYVKRFKKEIQNEHRK